MDGNGKIWIGTELKFRIEIRAGGFSMDEDPFTVELRRGRVSRTYTKDELATDGEGNWYLCFDTAEFGPGLYEIVTRAEVPDADFPDGFRTEVNRAELARVEAL